MGKGGQRSIKKFKEESTHTKRNSQIYIREKRGERENEMDRRE